MRLIATIVIASVLIAGLAVGAEKQKPQPVYYIAGEVKFVGVFELTGSVNLLVAVARADGAERGDTTREVTLYRKDGAGAEQIVFRGTVQQLLAAPDQAAMVNPGDSIIVRSTNPKR